VEKLAEPEWLPGSLGATAFMVLAWGYFIWTGNINTIWPLFGIANQLLGAVALSVATTILINIGRTKYAWVTFLPLCFLSVTTMTAGFMSIRTTSGRSRSTSTLTCTCRVTSSRSAPPS
jgi:carbon starvation protein